jgi:flagellar M-ring protein FliF
MNEILQRMKERIAALGERLTTVQKIAIIVVSLLMFAVVGALAWYGTRVEMVPLYTELKQEDAGKIADRLKEEKVPFTVEKGGSTILVPADQADALRIMLAADGPIDANPGYKLFDGADMFGMPEEVIQLNKRRALEGELAKTIEAIEEIKAARVHLALPPDELFVEDQKPATASVILNMKPGGTLRPKQVTGIVNLVAGAVPGLDADNVTVVNQAGKVLKPANEEQLADLQRNVDYQRNVEKELEQKATEVLEKAVGRGKAVVRVRVKLDFTKEQRTEELFDPQQQVARSEENLSETRANGADRVGGAPGAPANDPNVAQGVIRVGDASNSSREKQTINYEISKVTRQVEVPEIKLSRVSVAVLVDGMYKEVPPAEGSDAAATKEYQARTPAEIETITSLVAKAVELDTQRGDQIEVANLQFQESPDEFVAARAGAERQALIDKAINYGLILVFLLLIVFVVLRPVVAFLTAPPPPAEIEEIVEEGALPEPEPPPALPGEEAVAQLEQRELTVNEKIREFAVANPDVAAAVLRYWLRPRYQG